MNENTSFNLSRFGKLLKADLTANRKLYLFRFFGESVAFLLAAILILPTESMRYTPYLTLFLYMFIFGFLCLRSASTILECMNNKEKSIQYLMLPSSNLEKFLSRICISTLFFILIATPAAFYLSESVRLLLNIMIYDVDLTTYVGSIKDYFQDRCNDISLMYPEFILACAFTHSLFILGGCIWRKHAMLKTIGVLLFFSVVVQPLLLSFIPDNVNAVFASEWVIYLSIAGLTLLCWWGSYRLFCRKQVI
ncbi:MAG: hypothetical protein IJ417_00985 [Bacteroidaceae bacterium]|nr:hypothetical protein [Bacteroidaceae bacterium]